MSFACESKRSYVDSLFVEIYRFVGPIGVLTPYIVDSNKDAEDIRLMGQAISFLSVVQIMDGIAADAGINTIKVVFRIFRQKVVCCEVHVAVSERPVFGLASAGVGYAVADKDNCVVRF